MRKVSLHQRRLVEQHRILELLAEQLGKQLLGLAEVLDARSKLVRERRGVGAEDLAEAAEGGDQFGCDLLALMPGDRPDKRGHQRARRFRTGGQSRNVTNCRRITIGHDQETVPRT